MGRVVMAGPPSGKDFGAWLSNILSKTWVKRSHDGRRSEIPLRSARLLDPGRRAVARGRRRAQPAHRRAATAGAEPGEPGRPLRPVPDLGPAVLRPAGPSGDDADPQV